MFAMSREAVQSTKTELKMFIPITFCSSRWALLSGEAASSGAQSEAEHDAQGAGTVLLVDDEELVRGSTAGMLADLGYRVVEADCGEIPVVDASKRRCSRR